MTAPSLTAFAHYDPRFREQLAASRKAERKAALILELACCFGFRVSADGDEIVLLAPLKMSSQTRAWFNAQFHEFKTEIIAAIKRETTRIRNEESD